MEIRAVLKYCRLSSRKARLVADQVRNMEAEKAVSLLKFAKQKGAAIIVKLLQSAIANANQNDEISNLDDLYIKRIYVDEGPTLKRIRPRAMGRAFPIRKRTCHITIVLDESPAGG